MSLAIDIRHGCGATKQEHIKPGAIPVQQKASSACCGEKLQPPADPAAEHEFECQGCSKPAERVLGPKTAHWTCGCGVRRSQVVTEATDDAPASPAVKGA